MSLRGYCRTLSDRIDCRPAIRITRLTTIARTGRLTKRSVMRILAVLRLRSLLIARLNLIVDENGCSVAQLENAGGHDLISPLEAGDHCDLVAARGPQLDKLLTYAPVCLPLCIL